MNKKIILSSIGVLAALFYLSSIVVAGGPETDPRCEGLTGAAFGMCQAATAVGCDDPATRNPGCDRIENNFTQITGEAPPWTVVCPCWDTNDLVYINSRFAAFICIDTTELPPHDCIDLGCADYYCTGDLIQLLGVFPEYCENRFAGGMNMKVTAEQYRACAVSLDPYF